MRVKSKKRWIWPKVKKDALLLVASSPFPYIMFTTPLTIEWCVGLSMYVLICLCRPTSWAVAQKVQSRLHPTWHASGTDVVEIKTGIAGTSICNASHKGAISAAKVARCCFGNGQVYQCFWGCCWCLFRRPMCSGMVALPKRPRLLQPVVPWRDGLWEK